MTQSELDTFHEALTAIMDYFYEHKKCGGEQLYGAANVLRDSIATNVFDLTEDYPSLF